jgi:hypothetical protein
MKKVSKKRISWIYRFVDVLLDYGPITLTVIVAIIASVIAGQSATSESQVLQLVLGVLVLLSTTQLFDRFRLLRDFNEKLDFLVEQQISGVGLGQIVHMRMPNLIERLSTAKTIDHNGITLVGTSSNLLEVFSSCLDRGGKIRLVVGKPDDISFEVSARRFQKHQDVAKLRLEIGVALDNFTSMYRHSRARSSFKIGLVDIVPPYSIWLLDVGTPRAEIWVNLYSYQDESEPSFQLFPHRDGELFEFFQDQFEVMWSSATPWSPTQQGMTPP